jgi:hypothetical protein
MWYDNNCNGIVVINGDKGLKFLEFHYVICKFPNLRISFCYNKLFYHYEI